MSTATPRVDPVQSITTYDVIIIGAGVTGLYQLYLARKAGLSVCVFDAAGGVGGTWYWNCYPGCRFDSESESYGYTWSKELLQEWNWTEHFSPQPETERYLNYVADRFDLRRDIQLNSRVQSAVFDAQASRWDVQLTTGQRARTQFLIAAVGVLSADYTPAFAGIESFKGLSLHTGHWPREGVDLRGKRVAVIGTGPTGVQLITEIARDVAHLTVFQRTPNYCAPLRNRPVTPETQAHFKATYDQIHQLLRETPAGFLYHFDARSAFDFTREERLTYYEKLWVLPGFAKWLSGFQEVMTDRAMNEEFAEFLRGKIRARINDPVLAEKLVPNNHPFGSKRIPLESGYFEIYNRDNVDLVELLKTPIVRITPSGIRTSDAEHEFDVIIHATGFDAVTGPLTRMDIRGIGGQTMREKWADGVRTYLGLLTAGFPNFFIATNSAFCNYPVCAEMVVEWIAGVIEHLRANNLGSIEATPDAEEAWVQHSAELASHSFLSDADSWFMGSNIPGKKRVLVLYSNSAPAYRAKCEEVAANAYEGCTLR